MAANVNVEVVNQCVSISAGKRRLGGILNVPRGAQGIVLFAHGSGSGRFSLRNQYVARALQQAGMATLLFDLLDEQEANDRAKVFDIGLLADRLEIATVWTRGQNETGECRIGYFGASTGGGAALVAAARQGNSIRAVVSRGGRPDLAAESLPRVKSPTLLIVGGDDEPVIELNRRALARLRCEKQLKIIPGATHLFEEPGALEAVARLASEWFQRHLVLAGSADSIERSRSSTTGLFSGN
jgi:putative phosphoribosyl transferase